MKKGTFCKQKGRLRPPFFVPKMVVFGVFGCFVADMSASGRQGFGVSATKFASKSGGFLRFFGVVADMADMADMITKAFDFDAKKRQ